MVQASSVPFGLHDLLITKSPHHTSTSYPITASLIRHTHHTRDDATCRLTYTNEFRQALNKRKKNGDPGVATGADTEVGRRVVLSPF